MLKKRSNEISHPRCRTRRICCRNQGCQVRAQVAIIEEQEVGGNCLNWGCIPTKAIIASIELLSKAGKLESFGLELSGEIRPNPRKIIARKDKIVSTQIKGIRNLFSSSGVTLKAGRGTLLSPRQLSVVSADGGRENIRPTALSLQQAQDPPAFPIFLSTVNVYSQAIMSWALRKSRRIILIIGAGVIGCEFACIFRELGVEVTMMEALPRAVATGDLEISEILERELKKKKIRLLTKTKADRIEIKDDGVHAFLPDGKGIVAEKALRRRKGLQQRRAWH